MNFWRRATRADAEAVELFLRGREAEAAGLIARLLEGSRIRIPAVFGRAGLWIAAEAGGPVRACVLGLAGGLWFVQLPKGEAGGMAEALGSSSRRPGVPAPRPHSVIGPRSSVEIFEEALGLRPAYVVDYRLMKRGAFAAAEARRARVPIRVEQAGGPQLAELLPLQAAYEREEVVTPLRGFDAEACRAYLARNLAVELIVAARLEEGGRLVGKAGTNARAFSLDQIGGVFVEPSLRGKGIGAEMMSVLLGLTAREGRGASLFVKKDNLSALGLYEGLGFAWVDDFRASYHLPR